MLEGVTAVAKVVKILPKERRNIHSDFIEGIMLTAINIFLLRLDDLYWFLIDTIHFVNDSRRFYCLKMFFQKN